MTSPRFRFWRREVGAEQPGTPGEHARNRHFTRSWGHGSEMVPCRAVYADMLRVSILWWGKPQGQLFCGSQLSSPSLCVCGSHPRRLSPHHLLLVLCWPCPPGTWNLCAQPSISSRLLACQPPWSGAVTRDDVDVKSWHKSLKLPMLGFSHLRPGKIGPHRILNYHAFESCLNHQALKGI